MSDWSVEMNALQKTKENLLMEDVMVNVNKTLTIAKSRRVS